MDVCGRCGTASTPGLRYCAACGADLAVWSRRGSDGHRVPVLVVTAVVVAALAVAAATAVGFRYSDRRVTGVATAAGGSAVVPTWTPPPPAVPAPTTVRVPTTVAAVSPDEVALSQLNAEVAADRAAVESLVDRWVPQLSSKRLGLVVHGVRFTHEDIWRDFQLTRARYPDALLLSSADYASFDSGDFWVTVVPRTYAAGAEANAWCDRELIGPDDCFAKRLTHTGTSAGTTLPRR
ncbi:zinc ribbon domain-containing protein [Actinosynnema sp. NPDC053489]|uniref:zinc ribbon domain-containing protein n=1 Tax=Actinosynnema sp. NPDC053489 TaxID=3363916 RepID=UPI0037C6AB5B